MFSGLRAEALFHRFEFFFARRALATRKDQRRATKDEPRVALQETKP
jgi:hypothetical protein